MVPSINFQDAKLLQEIHFLTSAVDLARSPHDTGLEVAFVGRSNAGKSSAINSIVNRRALARTSKTPGRTQLINYFEVDEHARLVDLPGYGYAKIPQKIKIQIEQILINYLTKRKCLCGLILLMDIRHPMTDSDKVLMDLAATTNKPVHILLTKCDKLKRNPANQQLMLVKKQLIAYGDKFSVQMFSALKQQGLEEARNQLTNWLSKT